MNDLHLPDALFTGGPAPLLEREWLVTNGIGGYASSTLAGAAARRYHGLLTAADPPPNARWVLVSGADEFVGCSSGREIPLSTQRYADGTLHPDGFRSLAGFRLHGQRPIWRYDTDHGRVEKTVWMPRGANRTHVRYTNHARQTLRLRVRPFLSLRWFHQLRRGADPTFAVTAPDLGSIHVRADGAAPAVRLGGPGWRFEPLACWYWNFHRPVEQARGFDAVEDAFAPGDFTAALAPGASITLQLAAAAELWTDAAAAASQDAFDARSHALAGVDGGDVEQRLRLAADQMLVWRGPRVPSAPPEPNTVVAGYPWFGDWGRDTMIALPGLCLDTGRASIAKAILLTYARHVNQGMLPNRWPDEHDQPEYGAFDAALWFVYALAAYTRATNDTETLAALAAAVLDVIDWHLRGTRHGIRVDPADGLLTGGAEGAQLTWMDAKFEDWVVTPRRGKPVEINALWFAALEFADEAFTRIGWRGAYDRDLLDKVRESFPRRFWNPATGGLFDVVDGPHGDDPAVRPNQVIAAAAAGALLTPEQRASVLDLAERTLLTPVGLRSLAPDDPAYAARYAGGPAERDGSYHQGPVWSWLLGMYVQARLDAGADARTLRHLRDSMRVHLSEALVGSVSEIFQPEPPFRPDGAPAQAWGIGEWLRGLRLLRAADGR